MIINTETAGIEKQIEGAGCRSCFLGFTKFKIIIDGPPGIGCPVISSATGVDKVVIVTEPTINRENRKQ